MKNFNKIKEQMQKTPPIQEDPNMSGQPEMSQEEMKADLSNLMAKVDSKYQNFNSLKLQEGNEDQKMKEETLNQIFEALAKAGIDGTDPAQINAFLEKIKTSSPELYQFFSEAISSLMGGDMTATQEQPLENTSMQVPQESQF